MQPEDSKLKTNDIENGHMEPRKNGNGISRNANRYSGREYIRFIRMLRLRRGWTQQDMVDALNDSALRQEGLDRNGKRGPLVTQSSYSKVENHTSRPSLDFVLRCIEVLGMKPSQFFANHEQLTSLLDNLPDLDIRDIQSLTR